jgi:predicted small secreted protein
MRSVVNRRLAVLPLLAAAVFGLAACNSTTTGTGTPAATNGGSAPSSSDAGSSSSTSEGSGSPSGEGGLASVQPCSLVSSSALSQYQLTPSGTSNADGARSCDYHRPVDINGQNGAAVGIDVRDSQGLKDIAATGYTVTDDNIGSHQGKQAQLNAGGGCFVAIGVGDSARVDVQVSATANTTQACQLANALAKVVEPRLPAGGN